MNGGAQWAEDIDNAGNMAISDGFEKLTNQELVVGNMIVLLRLRLMIHGVDDDSVRSVDTSSPRARKTAVIRQQRGSSSSSKIEDVLSSRPYPVLFIIHRIQSAW